MRTLLLLSVLIASITLGCLQKHPIINEASSEAIGVKIHTDRDVYVKEPIMVFIENTKNKTIKIKPKIPWEICSNEKCLEINQSSVAFGIKKNGYESGKWIVLKPGGVAIWTFWAYPSLKPGDYFVKLSRDAVVVVDGKECSVKALCKFKVLEEEPGLKGLKVGRLHLIERKSKFGSINVRGSGIFAEGVTSDEGKGLSLLFSIEPPLKDSVRLYIKSELGFVRIMLYSASSSWYTVEISNFVNKTQRAVDVSKIFFKKVLDVDVTVSKDLVVVENIDTGEKITLYPSEEKLKETCRDSLEISATMQPPTYIIYGDTMTVSFEFGERKEFAEYLLITTGFSHAIPREPKFLIVPDFSLHFVLK